MNLENIRYVKESEWNTDKKINTFSNLNSRHVVIMNKIKKFYNHKNNLQILISIINGDSYLSLRVIDYFVTNYAREKEIIYDIATNNKKENFMVYYSYKSQLKAYSKKQFDPFCRRERILFFIDKYDGISNDPIRTTIGQLNFFRWAIKNNILDYIYNNYESIENEMNKFSKKVKKKVYPDVSKEKKRKNDLFVLSKEENIKENIKENTDLTLCATKKVNKHNITITVKFN
jgi:hypothetical protein